MCLKIPDNFMMRSINKLPLPSAYTCNIFGEKPITNLIVRTFSSFFKSRVYEDGKQFGSESELKEAILTVCKACYP